MGGEEFSAELPLVAFNVPAGHLHYRLLRTP
jgi:hypothetical protein